VGLVSDQQIKALAGAEVAAMPLQALVGDERHRVPRRARRDEEMKSINHCQIGRRPLEHGHVERVRRAAKPLAKLRIPIGEQVRRSDHEHTAHMARRDECLERRDYL